MGGWVLLVNGVVAAHQEEDCPSQLHQIQADLVEAIGHVVLDLGSAGEGDDGKG
jgi:hypothetical protein